MTEDINVEHLLDVFTSIDADAGDALDACAYFIEHLERHKPWQTVLRSKIESLSDDHPSKTNCLIKLSWLFQSVGNFAEQKRILSQVLTFERKQGSGVRIAEALQRLSRANRMLGLCEEGIQQAREALEIFERLGVTKKQAESLGVLGWLLLKDKQLDAAEEAATRAIHLLPEKGQEFEVCQCQRLLGNTYRSKGKREKTIHHSKVAIEIASRFNWHIQLFCAHYLLAELFRDEGAFDDSNAHIEQAKLHAVGHEYHLGRAAELHAEIWYRQGKFKEARSEVLHAKEIYEKPGLAMGVQQSRDLLQKIDRAEKPVSLE